MNLSHIINYGQGPCFYSIGQAGYVFKNKKGSLLAFDLYLSNCVERFENSVGFRRLLPQLLQPNDLKYDCIICTHPHLDHFDVDAIPEMMSGGGRLYCSLECNKLISETRMNYFEQRIVYVEPGMRVNDAGFDIFFTECDHGESAPDAVGAIIEFDERKIYLVGDSCLRLDQVQDIPKDIDVLITPINGEYGNMNSVEAALLSESLRPRVTIPCHYGMFASHGGDIKGFYDEMNKRKLPFYIMCQGEKYSL